MLAVATRMTDVGLIKLAIDFVNRGGVFLLDSPVGSMELHGEDLYLSESNGWMAIYHGDEPSGEIRSHLHLKCGVLKSARIIKEKEYTPYLAFWVQDSDGEPVVHAYFPSFYDWSNNKAIIQSNKDFFKIWERRYGSEFVLE